MMPKAIILSVDDDPGLQVVLSQYLESEGYGFVSVQDGEALASKLETLSPDVILLDLILPGADGTSLISLIRARQKTPIIVVSGKQDTTEKIICLEMGADDYLTKPFEMRELSARIKAVLRRTPLQGADLPDAKSALLAQPEKTRIEIGGLIMDSGQYQVFDRNEDSCGLTTGEFQLLEALVQSPHRTLSRDRLFELTRAEEYDISDRAIDIQVGKLRKKMGQEGTSLIRTVRGIGYMYCPSSSEPC